MRIVLFCATQRGYRFLEKMAELAPAAELVVFSFRETPHEPPYLDDIRSLTKSLGGVFHEARQVGNTGWDGFWNTTRADLMFAVSWRYLIPENVYSQAHLGAYVFHDSLLPAYRGFSPTVWAIINGEDHTGVTLFEIAATVDSGAVVDQQRVSIDDDDTIATVLERVTQAYLEILARNLPSLMSGNTVSVEQDHSRATYTCRRLPNDNLINWQKPAQEVYNLIRAVTTPYPGAYTTFKGRKLIIWKAQLLRDYPEYKGHIPGRVVEVLPDGVVVLAGDGAILVKEAQFERSEREAANAILSSTRDTLGQ